MADEPETLEETQARLARVQPSSAQPPVSSPTPMRPDPYAASHTAPPDVSAPITTTRRPASVVAVALGVVAVVAIGGITAYNAFSGGGSPSPNEPGGAEPEYSQEWQRFPGVSYIDPNEALAQPSYEEVVAGSDALLSEYRDALTAEFGFVWSQRYETYTGLESNGYGGDSMLYYYDSGSWQGQVQLNDPGARERIFQIFSELSASNAGEGVLLRNDLYSDDADTSSVEFGAAELDDQALWSFFDAFPALAGGYLSVDVMDRTIPVGDDFDGDYMFTYDESTDTLYVAMNGFAGALLKEGDRAAFEAALEPYHGDYEP